MTSILAAFLITFLLSDLPAVRSSGPQVNPGEQVTRDRSREVLKGIEIHSDVFVPTYSPFLALSESVEDKRPPVVRRRRRHDRTLQTRGSRPSLGDLCAPEGSYTSDPGDCSKYYWCVFGRLLPQICPQGLYFNPASSSCDWPSNVQCSGGESPTPPRPSTAKPTTKASTLTTTVVPSTPSSSTTVRPDGASCCNVSSSSPSHCDGKPIPCGSYKVVCYFTNWAMYRPGNGSFTSKDVDPALCTHVVYAFATLHPTNHVVQVFDTWADTDPPNEHYRKVAALRSQGVCVLLGLGGWGDSAGPKYSQLCNSPARRATFVAHVISFLQKFGFCGLDVDIEFPSCPQTYCTGSTDKKCFSDLMCELKSAFRPVGLLLTMAVSPSAAISDQAYDIPRLSPCVDLVSLMTYDYHGQWDGRTGHVAPLFYMAGDAEPSFNAHSSVQYWLDRGLPPCKLLLGLPTYGQSFRLADPTQNGLNARTVGGGAAGTFTRASGFLAFYEICKNAQLGWSVRSDVQLRVGPYAFQGDQWVSFDDCRMALFKAQYVKKMGLGGAMVWALDLDDFRNVCGCEKYPLLKTLNRGLCRLAGEPANCCIM